MGDEEDLIDEVRRFRSRLEDSIGPVEHLILFGSQADGETHEWSDDDLIVVSPAFEGLPHIERAAETRRHWQIHVPVDLVCYTPSEFEGLRGQVSLVDAALRDGRDVASA